MVYLDLALEGQVRVVIERSLPAIREWGMADVVSLAGLALENYGGRTPPAPKLANALGPRPSPPSRRLSSLQPCGWGPGSCV